MPEIPRKRGRPRLYTKKEKARRDVDSRRLRRQAQSAAARLNRTQSQARAVEHVRAGPLSHAHETTSQSLTSLGESADATTSQGTTSQPRQPQDLSHGIGAYSGSPIVCSLSSGTLFVEELPNTHHQSPIREEFFATVCRPYKSIYADLNPPQAASPCYQPAFEPTQEEALNCSDNDDGISPPSDLPPIDDATPNEDSNEVLVTEQPTGFVGRDTNDVSGETEGGVSGPQQDGNTSGQEEDSEFEFVAEDTETDSESEADLSPDGESTADREIPHNHVQSHHSLAKSFLENTWNHLCGCEDEDSPLQSGQGRVLSLKQMAEYWQALGVPDAIGSAALPDLVAGERSIDWFSVLGGGELRPHLRLEGVPGNCPGHQTHLGCGQHRPMGYVLVYQPRAVPLVLPYPCEEPPNQSSRLPSRAGPEPNPSSSAG